MIMVSQPRGPHVLQDQDVRTTHLPPNSLKTAGKTGGPGSGSSPPWEVSTNSRSPDNATPSDRPRDEPMGSVGALGRTSLLPTAHRSEFAVYPLTREYGACPIQV